MPQLVPRKQVQRVPAPAPPPDPLTQRLIPTTATVAGPTRVSKIVKTKVEQVKMDPESSDEEELSFESIVRDKPSPKKVAMFIQECVNDLMKDSDEETSDQAEDSDYSRV